MPRPNVSRRSDEGFALIGMIVAIFIILLFLSAATVSVARSLRREREVEAQHRAAQYLRAIRLYYKKVGSYPGSLEQLEKTNNVRYLRQRYNDPFTGKPDWRLIKVGQNKTTVKDLFGQPLAGLASTGVGSASNMVSPGGSGSPIGSTSGASAGGSMTSSGSGSGLGGGLGGGLGSSNPGGSNPGGGGAGSFGSPTGGTGSGAASPFGSSSAGSSNSGPFMGVGLPIEGASIVTVNEKTTYPDWEFLYDPRIEQRRANVNLLGGGMSSTNAGSLGTAKGMMSGMPSSNGPTSPTSPTSPTAPLTNSTIPPQ